MAEGATKRYFEEILEVTGVGRKGPERLDEIRNMPEVEFENFAKDLSGRVRDHYEKNTQKIFDSVRSYEDQPRAFYFGASDPITPPTEGAPANWFIKKIVLYYGKVTIRDLFDGTLPARDFHITENLKATIVSDLAGFAILWPWVKVGLMEVLPDTLVWTKSLREMASKLADEDEKDERWASSEGALKSEDMGLEGQALIQFAERTIQEIETQKNIDRKGGLRNYALGTLLWSSSLRVASGFFGSALTNSSPTTDWRQYWRLFGLWSSKRAELLVQRGLLDERTWMKMREETKAGRVWQGLKLERLGALMELSPEQIIKVRDDSKLSLKSFREELGEKVKEIETVRLADEEEIGRIVSQVSEDLNKEAAGVQKDLKNVRRKIGVSAGLTPLGLSLGLLPFPEAKLASILVGVYSLKDIAGHWFDIQRQKERSGYFLVRLEKEAEEEEILRRRGVTSKWRL